MTESLCGLWIDVDGTARLCVAGPDGRRTERTAAFRPFAWLADPAATPGLRAERLQGEGPFAWLGHADTLPEFEAFLKAARDGTPIDVLKPYESQWLLQQRARLYADMPFAALRRCQLDIETAAAGGECVAVADCIFTGPADANGIVEIEYRV